jgi:hypothetical protein
LIQCFVTKNIDSAKILEATGVFLKDFKTVSHGNSNSSSSSSSSS